MGRKRRLLAAKGKFQNKFNTHPRYVTTEVTTEPSDIIESEQIDIIAKKVETIEQEVIKTEQRAENIISAIVSEETPKPKIKAETKTKPKTSRKKSAATKSTNTTKNRRTRKTAKK